MLFAKRFVAYTNRRPRHNGNAVLLLFAAVFARWKTRFRTDINLFYVWRIIRIVAFIN